MRLLYLNHNVAGSGTFHRAFQLGREMVRRGHAVSLVTTSPTARLQARWLERDGMRVLEAPDLLWGPGRTGWDPYNVLRRVSAIAGLPFDLVHAFDCRPAVIFPAMAAARAGATLFIDWADWWGRGGTIVERSGWPVRTLFGPIETWFEEAFRTRAAAATVISSALRDRCVALGVPRDRILRIPHGCRPPDPAVPGRAQARSALGLDDRPLLVHVGTAHPRDAALLFDAFRRARIEEPTLKLALVGDYRGGAVPADLLEAGGVRVTGRVAQEVLPLWLASADACVATLRDTVASRGRWPSKVNDYFTAGRATVMPAVGDAAEYVRSSEAGIACAPEVGAFAAAIVRIVRDATVRSAAERNALALAATLAWAGIAKRLGDFYAEMMHAPTAPVRASA